MQVTPAKHLKTQLDFEISVIYSAKFLSTIAHIPFGPLQRNMVLQTTFSDKISRLNEKQWRLSTLFLAGNSGLTFVNIFDKRNISYENVHIFVTGSLAVSKHCIKISSGLEII